MLLAHVPVNESFILVDDEQIRHGLPHSRALPFLEKQGQYWGPPADDETAIRELERMKSAGAMMIVFVWPCFWWLERYPAFQQYLRKKYVCLLEDKQLIIFKAND